MSMQTICFSNDGEIEVGAITTLGVSVKEDSAIGYFGTGLKFALAVILRHGGKIVVWSGMTAHEFTVGRTTIRGKQFDIVHMDDRPLGFTTELGRNWQPWMAYRELACNAFDEGGDVGTTPVPPAHGRTVIEVDCAEIANAYRNRSAFMIPASDTPVVVGKGCEAYLSTDKRHHLFYRKVAVTDEKVCHYRYNVTLKMDLTEDRTARYPWALDREIMEMWLGCRDKTLLRQTLDCDPIYSFEGALNWNDSFAKPSSEWLDVVGERIGQGRRISKSARSLFEKHRAPSLPEHSMRLDSGRSADLQRAINMLKRAGYEVDGLPIIVTAALGTGIMGLAQDGKIYISPDCFLQGDTYLAATLLEEWLHITKGFHDESREMQDWLFNNIALLMKRIDYMEAA